MHEKCVNDQSIQDRLRDGNSYVSIDLGMFTDQELIDIAKTIRRDMKNKFPGIDDMDDFEYGEQPTPEQWAKRREFHKIHMDYRCLVQELFARIDAA